MPAQLLAFYCKRLLDLHDQLGVPIDGIGVCDDRRASWLRSRCLAGPLPRRRQFL